MKKAVIVLPVWNEKNNLEKFINEIFLQQKNLPNWKLEILLVVDKRSNDGSLELSKNLSKRNLQIHNIKVGPGLGTALIEGHRYSIANFNPDVLVQMDADNQVDASVLPPMLEAIEEGYDLVLGSRFIRGGRNNLSLSRRIFSTGMSWFCRIVMGPFNIKEFANSSRAFTPELFKKLNLERLPWKEKTFIIQPAFLNEAILAGAKYKEVPLIFKNRAEGYSKNKTINYTYDVITYTLDARLHQWGLNIPLFYLTRRAKTLVKFAMVGVTGTLVDFIFYKVLINSFGFPPATSKAFSTEIAIINNFTLNNIWTFRHRKTNTGFWQKLAIFNLVSLGGLSMAVVIVKLLHSIYGDGFVQYGSLKLAYNNFYFFATIPPVMIWNFTINHLVTWRHQKDAK